MDRSEIRGLPFEVEGDGAMCGIRNTKLPYNTNRRRHQQKRKRRERERDKPKPDEVKEMGAGSKEDVMVRPAKKLVTLRLSKELMDYIRTREAMGILAMATEKPRPSLERTPQLELFGRKLKAQIIGEYEENREFDAYVLYQYHTKGYAEIQYLTDDEEV